MKKNEKKLRKYLQVRKTYVILYQILNRTTHMKSSVFFQTPLGCRNVVIGDPAYLTRQVIALLAEGNGADKQHSFS